MNNNNDQAQFAKDVFQFPSHQADVLMTPEATEAPVERPVTYVAREETRLAFEAITKELAMVASGIEIPKEYQIEAIETHPDAIELLTIGKSVKEMRDIRHAELIQIQSRRGLKSVLNPFFGNTLGVSDTFLSKKGLNVKQQLLHDLIDKDSMVDGIFPADRDVKSLKFFYLPSDTVDDAGEYFHQQVSAIPEKNFTNSYPITAYGIKKSSTFFDPIIGHVKNVSVIPEDLEINNLKIAATNYRNIISQKIYNKPTTITTRRLFGSKSDYDLTA